MRRVRMLVALACATLLLIHAAGAGNTQPYDVKLEFKRGVEIELPDFTLEYTGQHRTSSPKYPRGFLFCDFKIRAKSSEKTVSWSSGTGEIAPAEFEIGGKHFLLELQRSDKFGPLKDNELVIRKN